MQTPLSDFEISCGFLLLYFCFIWLPMAAGCAGIKIFEGLDNLDKIDGTLKGILEDMENNN